MGAKCVEKTHRSNSVLMNTLRGRSVAASALHQPVTSRADEENRPYEQHVKMEQELFQSKHVSCLESNATTQQSVSLSYDQVYKARSKKSLNSTWLDTQKRPVLVWSRLVVKQVRRASKGKDVCMGTPPLKAMSIVLPRTSRGHGSCTGLSNVSVVFFHGENEAELLVCLMKSTRQEEINHLETFESRTWNAGCEYTLAKTGSKCVAIHCSGQTGCGVCLVRCYRNEWHDT